MGDTDMNIDIEIDNDIEKGKGKGKEIEKEIDFQLQREKKREVLSYDDIFIVIITSSYTQKERISILEDSWLNKSPIDYVIMTDKKGKEVIREREREKEKEEEEEKGKNEKKKESSKDKHQSKKKKKSKKSSSDRKKNGDVVFTDCSETYDGLTCKTEQAFQY